LADVTQRRHRVLPGAAAIHLSKSALPVGWQLRMILA
jgi:hypothetical protein